MQFFIISLMETTGTKRAIMAQTRLNEYTVLDPFILQTLQAFLSLRKLFRRYATNVYHAKIDRLDCHKLIHQETRAWPAEALIK